MDGNDHWVQHKSGQGEKWKVYQGDLDKFKDLYMCEKDMITYCLPKSEYAECEPPAPVPTMEGEDA